MSLGKGKQRTAVDKDEREAREAMAR